MYPSTSFIIAVFLIARTASATAGLPTTCFQKSNNLIEQDQRSPCGKPTSNHSFLSCCGSGDQCLPGGLCSTKEKTGSLAAGYYVGGCTDPSLQDPSCNPACGDLSRDSVVYNFTSSDWQCCGMTNGIVNCSSPTNERFSASVPSVLQATYTISSSASTGGSSGGLSAGAKAGIAIPCIIAGLAIFGAIAYACLHQRHQHQLAVAEAKKAEVEEEEQEQQRQRQHQRQRQWLRERIERASSVTYPPSYRPPTNGSMDPNSPAFLPVFDPITGRPVEKPIGRTELPGSLSTQAELPDDSFKCEMF